MDRVRWDLERVLREKGITPYKLVQNSNLARNTVYSAVRGKQDQVRLSTIAGILQGLRRITGENTELSEILVHEQVPDHDEQGKLTGGSLSQSLEEVEANISVGERDAWLARFFDQADGQTK